jgi:uncharacterized membrane protein YedE/YeeE
MDFVPLMDLLGEEGAVLAGGFAIGLAFGAFAQRSAFCTRSAVLELSRNGGTAALSVWLAGFAAALVAVQAMMATGALNVAESRYIGSAQSLSGALVGGGLFGIGMALTRGCVSRLVVLSATGNVRALFGVAVVALVGYATITGTLGALRDPIAQQWSTASIGGNDLAATLGLGRAVGIAAGTAAAAAVLVLVLWRGHSPWKAVGGAGVGLSVAAGWYFTCQMSSQMFEPIPVESLSFVRPVAMTGALAFDWSRPLGLDQGVLAGVIAGAFVAAALFRNLRWQTFGEPGTPGIARYASGAALMGFGGALAGGCTVGAGLSGGSILAISALLALAAMVAGAVVADRVLDRG